MMMVGADHSAGDWNAAGGDALYLGDPVGFVIELEDGFRFYFAGDTQVYSDMRLIRDLHRPDLAMLPIGGHFTMDPWRRRWRSSTSASATSCRCTTARSRSWPGRQTSFARALAERGLGGVTVHSPAPGGTIGG